MAKNANGEGSIWKRMRDGHHTGYIGAIPYTGDDGKTKRHVVYGRTRAESLGWTEEADSSHEDLDGPAVAPGSLVEPVRRFAHGTDHHRVPPTGEYR